MLTASEPAAARHKYRLKFVPDAWAEWSALDGSLKEPLKKLLKKRLDQPRVPGAELRDELNHCFKIKLLRQGYRLIYEIDDDALVVLVLAVDRREDSTAYNSAAKRLREKISR